MEARWTGWNRWRPCWRRSRPAACRRRRASFGCRSPQSAALSRRAGIPPQDAVAQPHQPAPDADRCRPRLRGGEPAHPRGGRRGRARRRRRVQRAARRADHDRADRVRPPPCAAGGDRIPPGFSRDRRPPRARRPRGQPAGGSCRSGVADRRAAGQQPDGDAARRDPPHQKVRGPALFRRAAALWAMRHARRSCPSHDCITFGWPDVPRPQENGPSRPASPPSRSRCIHGLSSIPRKPPSTPRWLRSGSRACCPIRPRPRCAPAPIGQACAFEPPPPPGEPSCGMATAAAWAARALLDFATPRLKARIVQRAG